MLVKDIQAFLDLTFNLKKPRGDEILKEIARIQKEDPDMSNVQLITKSLEKIAKNTTEAMYIAWCFGEKWGRENILRQIKRMEKN